MRNGRSKQTSAKHRSFWSDDHGSTMVEFSIVAFLFVLILLGIAEFGLATWAKNSVANAAREGTRFAMVRGAKSGRPTTQDQVRAYVQSRASISPITVTAVWNPDKEVNSIVSVTVVYAYKRVGLMIPNKNMTSTSKMPVVF